MVDCSTEYGNEGCNGGLMNFAFDYVMEHHLNTEEKYSYEGRDNKCKTSEIGEGDVSLTGCV